MCFYREIVEARVLKIRRRYYKIMVFSQKKEAISLRKNDCRLNLKKGDKLHVRLTRIDNRNVIKRCWPCDCIESQEEKTENKEERGTETIAGVVSDSDRDRCVVVTFDELGRERELFAFKKGNHRRFHNAKEGDVVVGEVESGSAFMKNWKNKVDGNGSATSKKEIGVNKPLYLRR